MRLFYGLLGLLIVTSSLEPVTSCAQVWDPGELIILEKRIAAVDEEDPELLTTYGRLARHLARYELSTEAFETARDIYLMRNDTALLALMYDELGETNRVSNNFQVAVDHYLRAIRLNEEIGDQRQLVINYTNMANLYLRQFDFDQLTLYNTKAVDLLNRMDYPLAEAKYYNNVGRVHNNEGRFDSAIWYHRRAASIFDSLGMWHDKGRALHNVANSTREMQLFEESLQICREVMAIDDIRSNPRSHVFTLLLMADNYNRKGNPTLGISMARESLAIASENNLLDRKRVALLYLSQCYENLPDYKKAFEYHQKYSALQDSIFNLNRTREIARLETLFETEQNRKRIELQSANLKAQEARLVLQETRNSRLIMGIIFVVSIVFLIFYFLIQQTRARKHLELQKLEIERQNKERETLLKEIHHRVKNNLQIISSILNLQSRSLEDDSARDAVREGRSRIKSMALIHQKLYGTENLSSINMKEYIHELSQFLFNTYKTGIQLDKIIEAEDLDLDIDQAIPVGLILNELVSNALKYAFEDAGKGELLVGLYDRGDQVVLKVKDNGIGLPKDFESGTSMGMRLINTLTNQLEGQLSVENGRGAGFEISFKPIPVIR